MTVQAKSLQKITSRYRHLLRFARWLIIALILFIFYCAAIFWLLPVWIKKSLPEYSQSLLGCDAHIEDIYINPLTLAIEINSLSVTYRNDPLLNWKTLRTNLDPWRYTTTGAIIIASLDVDGLILNIQRNTDGKFNIGQVLEQLAANTANKNPTENVTTDSKTTNAENTEKETPVIIESISLIKSAVKYSEDLPGKAPPKTLFTYDISGDIRGSNINTAENQQGKITSSLILKNAGTLSSDLAIQLKPLKISGEIKLDKVVLGDAFSYIASNFRFELASGTLNANIPFSFENDFLHINNSQIVLQKIIINDLIKGNDTTINAPTIMINGLSLDSKNSHINIKTIDAVPGNMRSRLDENHEFRLAKLFEPVNTNNKSESTWKIDIGNISLKNWKTIIIDEYSSEPVTFTLNPTNLAIRDFSTTKKSLLLAAETKLGTGGTITINGPIKFEPFSTELDINVDAVNLPFTQTYWKDQLLIDLLSGAASTKAKLTINPGDNNSVVTRFQGNVVIDDVKTQARGDKRPLINWKKTTLNNVQFSSSPLSLSVGSVDSDTLYAKIVINKDKSINVQKLIKPAPVKQSSTNTSSGKQSPKDPALDLSIGDIELINSRMDFTDQNIQPNFSTDIQKLRGHISGIGDRKKHQAIIDLKGRVNAYAPVTIAGQFNPENFTEFADITINFRNIDMTAFTPYSGTFAGYKIEKGKLRVNLHYVIDNRKLTAQNNIFADQLTLGEPVPSASATTLPVKLAISLLKNSKGEIDIDLPISGDIDNPDFSIKGLLVRAFTNLIKQAISAPFKMLGNLVGSKEELDNISFPAGLATLSSTETDKLKKLATALNQRPELYLEITRTVNPDIDVLALRNGPESAPESANKENPENKTAEPVVITEEEEEALRELATQRAQLIRKTLQENGIKPRRLYVIDKIQKTPQIENGMIDVELKISSK